MCRPPHSLWFSKLFQWQKNLKRLVSKQVPIKHDTAEIFMEKHFTPDKREPRRCFPVVITQEIQKHKFCDLCIICMKQKRIKVDWCKTSIHQHGSITRNQVLVLFLFFESLKHIISSIGLAGKMHDGDHGELLFSEQGAKCCLLPLLLPCSPRQCPKTISFTLLKTPSLSKGHCRSMSEGVVCKHPWAGSRKLCFEQLEEAWNLRSDSGRSCSTQDTTLRKITNLSSP